MKTNNYAVSDPYTYAVMNIKTFTVEMFVIIFWRRL